MKTKLLMSAAAIAVLMAGGVANAQSPGGARGESPAAGASGGASVGGAASGGGMSVPSAKGAAEGGASGAVESHGSQKSGMSAQGEGSAKGHAREAQDNKMGKSPNSHTATDSKNSERMNKNTASDSKSGAESKTTGNAATAAKAAPPAAKRTQITTAIKQEKVTAVTNVNFNVSVGARVPASVHFYPVPASVIAIYPEWRGYEFILVGGRYVIVAPETHEIVYILT
ncbi:hypothetical protein BN961_02207 [Afipia felis]|uniref:DUF1236 domain-containing protein n=1 Tax=Afipia felis TaxID=1035 RepID=A0A090N7L0_AFIFE|nr:DUF1236 domain-containing protein [Afipia felis]CEG08788.1 hypothetical protein BN961_02207 [Afipia felis]